MQPPGSFLKRATRNFAFSGFGTASNFIVGFLFAGLAIRYLGEARAGFFMSVAALTGLNALFNDFGLGAPAVRRVAALNVQGDFAAARRVVGSVCTVGLISSLTITVPLLLLFPKVFAWSRLPPGLREDAFWAMLMTLGGYILWQASYQWRATYTALERYDLMSLLDTAYGLLTGLASITILLCVPTMSALAAVRLGCSLARSLTDACFMRRLLHRTPWPSWHWREIRPLAAFSGWVYLEDIGTVLLTRANSLVLTTFLGSAPLPYYQLPQSCFNQVNSALGNQCQFIFPMLASYGEGAALQARRVEDRLRWFVALGSGAIYTLLALIGPLLLARLVSPAFASKAQLPLYLACLQGFCQAQSFVPSFTTYALGWGKPNAVIRLAQGACALLAGLLLIPRFGVLGASLAQLVVILAVVAQSIWVRRLVTPDLPALGWLAPLGSPAAMILVWLTVARLAELALPPGIPGACVAGLAGGIAGLGCLLAIEAGPCRANQRWATLTRVISLPLRKLSGRAV